MPSIIILSTLIASGLATALLALYAWKNSRIKGAFLLAIIFFLGAFWSFACIQEILAPSLRLKLLWDNSQFLSYAFLPVFWLVLILTFVSNKPLNIAAVIPLFIIPLATNILVWSNDYHHLVRINAFLVQIESYFTIAKSYGLWFWVQAVYSNLLNLITLLLIIFAYIKGEKINRRQAVFLLIGFGLIFAADAEYLLRRGSIDFNYTPAVFGLSAIIIGVGILKDKLFHLAPLAREELFDRMNTGVIVLDELDRIVDMNKAALNIFGLADLRNMFRLPIRCIISDWREKFYSEELGERHKWELNIEHEGGLYCYELDVSNLTDRKQNLIGRLAVIYDITERKRSEEILAYTANHDTLTDLINRQYFKSLAEIILEESKSSAQIIALLYIDLDNFKSINDRYGHEVGDVLLQESARKLRKAIRQEDIAARIGGDEFIVLLTELKSENQAVQLAEKILALFREPVRINSIDLLTTLSIGLSYYPSDSQEMDNLLKKADMAMYWVKNNGRNNYMEYKKINN
jgi:diguanylate cyclase (GGDEF)-like protein/PAS domain S-box-containing protein